MTKKLYVNKQEVDESDFEEILLNSIKEELYDLDNMFRLRDSQNKLYLIEEKRDIINGYLEIGECVIVNDNEFQISDELIDYSEDIKKVLTIKDGNYESEFLDSDYEYTDTFTEDLDEELDCDDYLEGYIDPMYLEDLPDEDLQNAMYNDYHRINRRGKDE